MIFKITIGLFVLALALYYGVCFLQIFEVSQFTEHKVSIPKMFIPFYYLLKKEPLPAPEPEEKKRKKPSYAKPIKVKEDKE